MIHSGKVIVRSSSNRDHAPMNACVLSWSIMLSSTPSGWAFGMILGEIFQDKFKYEPSI